ncbi:hypothetical protein BROUX41_005108 [Berkeleyomyces rouxiae]|uniref:uncharacterized protein n=1 Tax=Berkeleyomyces rouxiae TaxID=2035830 RepID=UPI003B7D8C80
MASKANARAAANSAAQQLGEKQIQDGLNHLQFLLNKLVYLRSSLCDVVSTVAVSGSPTQETLDNIKATAGRVDFQVKELQSIMRGDKTKAVFELAVGSQKKDPLGLKPWNAMDHPGYYLQPTEESS